MTAEGHSPGRAWTIALVLVAGWLVSAQVGKVSPALPLVRADLGLSLVQAGWVATSINLVTATLGVAFGLMAARLGGRSALLAGLLFLTLGSLLGSLAPDGRLLIGSRTLESVGFVLVAVAGPTLLAAVLGDDTRRRRLWLIVWSCYMPIGMSLMMLLAPLVLEAAGWRGLWIVNALLLGLLTVIAVSQRSRLPGVGGTARGIGSLGEGLRLPGAWLMGFCFGCYSAIWFMLIVWLPSFAVDEMGLSLRAAAWLTAVAVMGNIGGNLLAMLVPPRVPRALVLAGGLVLIGSLGWMVFSDGFPPLARSVAAIVACGVSGIVPATIFAGLPAHVRRTAQLPIANGIAVQCANLGALTGPPAIAAIVTVFGGWHAGRWLIPAVACLGLAGALALRVIERRQRRASEGRDGGESFVAASEEVQR